MYHFMRRIHLYSGLVSLIYLLMYFVSGYMMIHRPWFLPPFPVPTVEVTTLPSIADGSPQEIAADVKRQLNIPGRIQFPTTQPGGLTRFWINYPGATRRADVVTGEKKVTLYTQKLGFVATLIMLHKIRGYDSNMLFNIYAFICDLSGLSLILFALTGVYLWWKRTKRRALGITCLVISCAYTAGMMAYFAYAR